MSTTIYPAADRTSQWFGALYVGSLMAPNNAVLHSTEGLSWPGYRGGATAPHFTIRPDFATKTVKVRQHLPINRSARALVNASGGVETNTLGCVQIEMVGTCDSRFKDTWTIGTRTYRAGVDYIYMPAAPDWFLQGVAGVLKWFDAGWAKFQLKDGAPRGWLSYPRSYGNVNGQRMSYSEWQANYGIVAHQHVPENAHGDAGEFPIARLVQIATGGVTPTPEPTPTPTPAPDPAGPVWGQPATWKLGGQSADVLKLGERINVWNEALGFPTWVPDDVFSSTERNDLSVLQTAWGFGSGGGDVIAGGSSDGYPGEQTFAKLDSAPPPAPTTANGLHWNIAGSNVPGYGDTNATRGDDVARWAVALGFDALITCEASQDNLRAGMNTVIGDLHPWEQRAKGIWHTDLITQIAPRKAYRDSLWAYLSNYKWGAAIFAEKNGIPFSFLEVHTDYRSAASQSKQLRSIFLQWREDCDELGIKHVNGVVAGDLNWDQSSADNPFRALEAYNYVEKGNRTISTFRTGKHLDGILAHRDADVQVDRPGRANEDGVNLSDHYPLRFKLRLS